MSSVPNNLFVNPENQWRLATPGHAGWERTPRVGAGKKYFMASADSHITPPSKLVSERIEPEFRDRLPRVEKRDTGQMWMHIDGIRPFMLVNSELSGEDQYRTKAGAVLGMDDASADMERRIADLDLDGIDAELMFPNGPPLAAFWTPDWALAQAQFRVYNDWVWEVTRPYSKRLKAAACIATGNVDSAITELKRVARMGFDIVALPTQPIPWQQGESAKYNTPAYDPLWAAIQDLDLLITFHVSTGGDPRKSRGPGGAIINRCRSHDSLVEPLGALCCSGILDRYRMLRFASVEAGIGWIPAFLDLMDESYRKHHMWVSPKLKHGLPSDYFRAHGAATFQEDRAGMLLVEPFNLKDNFCWASDYPHHEGTFPHSAEAIERDFGVVNEETRRKILGLNAARIFRFEIPERYR